MCATTEEYSKYLRTLESSTGLAVDKKTRVAVYTTVRADIYDPQDEDNRAARPKTLEHIKAFATGMLERFDGGNATRYSSEHNGEYSVQNQIEEMIEAFENTERNTNGMEGFWGRVKYYDSTFHSAVHNTNAVVCAQSDHIFGDDSAQYVVRRPGRCREEVGTSMQRKRARDEVSESRVDELEIDVKAALFECARTTGRAAYLADAHRDKAEAKAAAAAKFEEKKKEAWQKQVKSFVAARAAMNATPIIDDATVSGRTGLAALERRLDAYLDTCTSAAASTRALKGTIKRYVNGQGFSQLAPKSYTSSVDASIGAEGSDENLAFLRDTVLVCWRTIKSEKLALADEPQIPEYHSRVLSQLGTPTLDRVRAVSDVLGGADELRADADAYEAAASTRRSHAGGAGGSAAGLRDPPPIDATLLKRRVLVAWKITYTVCGGGKYTDVFWCPGLITQVSDEGTVVQGHGVVGMGWVWVEYDDGSKGWLIASRRGFFGASKAGSWMFEPKEGLEEEEEEDGPDLVDHIDEDEEE